MGQFELAIPIVLLHEGLDKYTNDPDDPGGATKWGVSLRYLRSLPLSIGDIDGDLDVDLDDIKALDRETAIRIVYKPLWNRGPYASFIDQNVANKTFDITVNMGARRIRKVRGIVKVVGGAHTALQRACRACGADIKDDGLIGPISIATINTLRGDMLLAAYRSEVAGLYRSFKKPKFEAGWLNRAYS